MRCLVELLHRNVDECALYFDNAELGFQDVRLLRWILVEIFVFLKSLSFWVCVVVGRNE